MVIMDSAEGKALGSLEELALKRKERLKNLKRKLPSGDSTNEGSVEIIVPLPKPKFRSYKPQDESLKEAKLEDAVPAAVEDEVKDLLEAGKEKKGSALKKEEVLHLLSLVERNPIVYTKTKSVTNHKMKDAAWVHITNQFNSAINSHPRKPEQLRLKWENLKKNVRKRNSNNVNLANFKSEFGIPDYVQPDEVLDKVASILGPSCEGSKNSNDGDISVEETDEMSTIVVIPSPSDEEDVAGPFDCVEVGFGGEACPSGVSINKSTPRDQRKRTYVHRTPSKSVHQNLMASEVESRIHRNNAIAEYYVAKKKKIDEEIRLNTEILVLQKKKVELEMLELQDKKGLIMDKNTLLLEKKQVELEILEIQRKKYSDAANLYKAASESI